MARHKVLRSPRSVRKGRKRAARKAVLLSLLTVLVGGGLLYTLSRQEFRIEAIEVSGSVRVPKEYIANLVAGELSGTYMGFIPKSHALLYPKSALKNSLMNTFPELSRVSISLKSLAALRVSVRERESRALLCSARENCFLMDETGFVFAKAEPDTEQSYYRFEKTMTSTPLGTVAIGKDRLDPLLSFLEQLEQLGLPPDKVSLQGEREITILLRSGARLLLREGDYERTHITLSRLLSEEGLLPKQRGLLGIDYIDLRYGNKIYFKSR